MSYQILSSIVKSSKDRENKAFGINTNEILNWGEQYKTVNNRLKGSIRKLKGIHPHRKLEQV